MTHHVEVISAALGAPVEAGQQHVFDVVARSVVELAHVEGPGLVVVKIGPLLQDLQDVLLNQVRVSDLVPGKEGSPLKEAKSTMTNLEIIQDFFNSSSATKISMRAYTFSKWLKIISVAKSTLDVTRKIKEMSLLVVEVATWAVMSHFQLQTAQRHKNASRIY